MKKSQAVPNGDSQQWTTRSDAKSHVKVAVPPMRAVMPTSLLPKKRAKPAEKGAKPAANKVAKAVTAAVANASALRRSMPKLALKATKTISPKRDLGRSRSPTNRPASATEAGRFG